MPSSARTRSIIERSVRRALVPLLLLLPSGAGAQDVLQGAQDAVNAVIESKETRYKRELAEQDRLRREEEELRWRRELEERERLQPRRGAAPVPLKAYPHSTASKGPHSVLVEVFVVSDCPDCDQLRDFLKNAGVSYELLEVDKDPAAEREYLAHVGRGVVPVTRVGNAVVRGYEPEKIREAINQAKSFSQPARSSGNSGDSWKASDGQKGAVLPELPAAKEAEGRYIPYDGSASESAPPTGNDAPLQADRY